MSDPLERSNEGPWSDQDQWDYESTQRANSLLLDPKASADRASRQKLMDEYNLQKDRSSSLMRGDGQPSQEQLFQEKSAGLYSQASQQAGAQAAQMASKGLSNSGMQQKQQGQTQLGYAQQMGQASLQSQQQFDQNKEQSYSKGFDQRKVLLDREQQRRHATIATDENERQNREAFDTQRQFGSDPLGWAGRKIGAL